MIIYGDAEQQALYQRLAETVLGTMDALIKPSVPKEPLKKDFFFVLLKNAAREFGLSEMSLTDKRILINIYNKFTDSLSNNGKVFYVEIIYKSTTEHQTTIPNLFNYHEIIKNEQIENKTKNDSFLEIKKPKKTKETTTAILGLLALRKNQSSVFYLGDKKSEMQFFISDKTREKIEANIDQFRNREFEYNICFSEAFGTATLELCDGGDF
ncbi:MAG: hypothetical protein BA874_10695 [Desulfuromonadales bacterium C00003068]|nr:MAG: hypothetical protein BA874_10695 [Desulfuromonadales bacterium C00003068]